MNEKSTNWFYFCMGTIVGFAIGILVCSATAERNNKIEAVKHNAGYWSINQEGHTTFHWNDEKKND